MFMLDEKLLKSYIKNERMEPMNNLDYPEKVALNLIAWGKKKGLKIEEVKDWYLKVSQSPLQDEIDKRVLEILEEAAKIESES